MKKIRCPKCDEAIQFDETRYAAGRILVFTCPACNKQFKIRMPRKEVLSSELSGYQVTPSGSEAQADNLITSKLRTENSQGDNLLTSKLRTENSPFLVVLENAFHLRQEIPLVEGENVVGRFVKGTAANAAFKTVDPSVDTTHCIITVSGGERPTYTLRDAPSGTGTFLFDKILRGRERVQIEDGAVITIGATTLIFHSARHSGD